MTESQQVLDVLSELKFQDIIAYDVHQNHPFSDTIILATSRNKRSLGAAMKAIKSLSPEPFLHVEGSQDSSWVLIIYGGVTMHLMTQDDRDYYHLEKLYFDFPKEHILSE